MKATIIRLIKEDLKYNKYHILIDGNRKYINIFLTQYKKQLKANTVIEVEESGQYFKFIKIIKEPKEEVITKSDTFTKKVDISMCFKLACNRASNIKIIPETTKLLYDQLQITKELINNE